MTIMRRALLLRIAAFLSLLTAVGHTIGTFMPIPTEQVQVQAAVEVMKSTLVPMPVGAPKSYMQILDGNNLRTTLLLLLCGALLLGVARAERSPAVDRVVLSTSIALGGVAVLSFVYFFPIPGVFTATAAALGLYAHARPLPQARTHVQQ